jgi:hypothetical protein
LDTPTRGAALTTTATLARALRKLARSQCRNGLATMGSPSSSRKGSRSKPLKDRRAPNGAAAGGSLRKLKGVLGRPMAIERQDGKLRVVLTERRRTRPDGEAPSLSLLCAELSARMLMHEAEETAQTMRHLILVHDALERHGWAGVETMSSLVLSRALMQAQHLANDEPSPHLDMLIEALRPLHAAAELRDQRESRQHDLRLGAQPEVSESNYADFEDASQSWSATMPADLLPPERGSDD